ncbi:MAG: hypothetical protein JXK94_10645 [Deltaproteobacteria bacterium]|nr:hypothetical protein [Deltaproteobacteria bacterium]
MDPVILAFGIQATLRAAQAGANLYGEQARDRKIFLPDLELPTGSRPVQLAQFLTENAQLASSAPILSAIWDGENQELKTTRPEVIDEAYAIMLEHKAKLQLIKYGKDENSAKYEARMLAAGRMVEQWREERKPPSPLIRMALTLTDIGLEFVGANPAILGVGSRGEKLIAAFATNMSTLLPDDVMAFGPRTDFADRVLGIFLRAGLGTLSNNASVVFKDEDIAKLLTGVTKPIVDSLPTSIAEQLVYRDLVDALAGPSAEAAFRLLAENTETYLGKNFGDDKALGAVTAALFEQIKVTTHGGSIVDVFSEQGVIHLYQACLGVAVERPELFTGVDNSAKVKLLKELLSGAAATLRGNPVFEGPVGAALAAMALEVVGENAPALLKLNPDEPWEKVALTALVQVTTGLSDALNNLDADGLPKGALKSFSSGQLFELGRVVLTQVARTPGMLGIRRSEVQSIIAGMAEAMAEDDNLLLSADEWTMIVAVAAQKAAANPGRLFGLSVEDQEGALAVKVVKSILNTAGDAWAAGGRTGKSLLFGETLEAALEVVLHSLAGNVTAITTEPELPGQLLRLLLDQASAKPEKFGSEGLLMVLQEFIGSVLASGKLPTAQQIIKTLSV